MEAKDKNIIIARYLGLQEVKEGTFKTKGTPLAKYCNYDTTSELKFNSDWNWLMYLMEKLEQLSDVVICIQGTYCALNYGGYHNGDIEGISSPKFTCSREKSIKISAVYECCSNFVLWLKDNESVESDKDLELLRVEDNNKQIYK